MLVLIEDKSGERTRRRYFRRSSIAFLEEKSTRFGRATTVYFVSGGANDLGAIHLAHTVINLPMDVVAKLLADDALAKAG